MGAMFPEAHGWLKENWKPSPSDSKTYIPFSHTTFHFPKKELYKSRLWSGSFLLLNEQNWVCKELIQIGRDSGNGQPEHHWFSLSCSHKKHSLTCQQPEPSESRGQIPTCEPKGNYVSWKYGLGAGTTTTKKPVIEMRIIAVEGGMGLETGCILQWGRSG